MQKRVTHKLFGLISCVNTVCFAFLANSTLQQLLCVPYGNTLVLMNFIFSTQKKQQTHQIFNLFGICLFFAMYSSLHVFLVYYYFQIRRLFFVRSNVDLIVATVINTFHKKPYHKHVTKDLY